MLAFVRDANTSQSVIDIFDGLHHILKEDFKCLFPVILTDNESEFSNPKSFEFSQEKYVSRGTNIYYCDAGSSYLNLYKRKSGTTVPVRNVPLLLWRRASKETGM